MCDQNVVGRPKIPTNTTPPDSLCSICLQKIGREISPPCLKSKKRSVESISNTIKAMDVQIQDKIVHNLLKSKLDNPSTNDKDKSIKLHTLSKPSTLMMNPSTSKHSSVPKETIDQIRSQAGLSLNRTKILTGGIRATLGRSSFPSHYREHASATIHVLEPFYKCERQNFFVKNKSDPIKSKNVWTVWAPVGPLIEFICNEREFSSTSDILIKFMGDSGQGKTIICFCIIPLKSVATRPKRRATYLEGGVLAKGFSYSGVNKCIMAFCAPEIKEINNNLEKIFNLLQIDEVFSKYPNAIFSGDLEFLNEVYGIMEASSRHSCIYCTANSQTMNSSHPRTLGSLKIDYENWKKTTGESKTMCKDFNNVKNLHLFKILPDDITPLKLSPPPTLHIMLGVFNHIWKNIESISEDHKTKLIEFANFHSCKKEPYFNTTFEGNECAKLMAKITSTDRFFKISQI